MKNINYIFYTGVVIIIFLIVSPTYWQYEVNQFHDAKYFYQINDFEGQTVDESYNILENSSIADANTFYIVRPTSSKNMELIENKYYFSNDTSSNNYNVESVIKFSTSKSELASFSESNGYFYSDLPYDKLKEEFSSKGLSLSETNDIYENDLSRFLYENALPISVVIFFTLIISIILSLKDVKEVALLSLQGLSEFKIKLKLTYRTFKGLFKTVVAVFLLFIIYKLLQGNHLSLVFFKFYFVVITIILIMYTLVYYLSLLSVSSVNIISVLKNKDYSRPAYISLLVIQSFVMLLVPILFSNYLNNYESVKGTKSEISRVYALEDYYTYYGVNANYYDSLTVEELSNINENFANLYNDNKDTSYYFEPVFSQYSEQYGEAIYQMPIENVVYMDVNYYKNIADFSKIPTEEVKNGTLLIPLSFKEKTDEIIESLTLQDKNVEIIYIDDNIELYFDDYKPEYSFSDDTNTFSKKGSNNVIVIADPNNLENMNPYANTIFIDKMTNGSIFFEMTSLQSMIKVTQEYHIDKMVTAESKISPYKNLLYNLEYTYKIISYTLILTVISVIVVNAFATEMIINTKKKMIAVGYLYGKNMMYSLKNNFIIYSVVSFISFSILYLMNKLTLETFLVILVLYLYVCIYLTLKYLNFINKKITTLLKGE